MRATPVEWRRQLLRQLAQGTGANAAFRATTAFNDDRVVELLNESLQELWNLVVESAPERLAIEQVVTWPSNDETIIINGNNTLLNRVCQAIISIEDRNDVNDVVQHDSAASYSDFRSRARTYNGTQHTVSGRSLRRAVFTINSEVHIFPLFQSASLQTVIYVPTPTEIVTPFGSGMSITDYIDLPAEFHELVPRYAAVLARVDDDRGATVQAALVEQLKAQVDRILDRMHASRGRRVIKRRKG